MFDQTFVDAHAQTRRPWTVAVSLMLQIGLVTAVLLAPLLHVAVLQRPETMPVWLPLQRIERPVEREAKALPRSAVTSRPVFQISRLQAPISIPRHVDMAPDAPGIADVPFNVAAGTLVLGSLPQIAIQPPPPPQAAAVSPKAVPAAGPIRVTGGVQSAKLVYGPKPAFPPLARATRTQGVVKIQAIIGRDGAIRNLQVLSGPPLLIGVAVEAVKQWRYQPTLLNGQPVEVVTEIDVNFIIG